MFNHGNFSFNMFAGSHQRRNLTGQIPIKVRYGVLLEVWIMIFCILFSSLLRCMLTGEFWGIYCAYFVEEWANCNRTTLYLKNCAIQIASTPHFEIWQACQQQEMITWTWLQDLVRSYGKMSYPLKTQNCQDANFVITGGAACSATSDDKVGILTTLCFQCLQ